MENKEGQEKVISTIKRKIFAIRNEKLSLALRVQIRTGMRANEVCNIKKQDIVIKDNKTFIRNHASKREKSRLIAINDDFLKAKLVNYIESYKEDENIFYKNNYYKKKSREYGIKTHDLRRIYARETLAELKKQHDKLKIKKIVQKVLGHSRLQYTNLYINKNISIGDVKIK